MNEDLFIKKKKEMNEDIFYILLITKYGIAYELQSYFSVVAGFRV